MARAERHPAILCKCEICGKEYKTRYSHYILHKRHYCSQACHNIGKSIYTKGEDNHQYGLKGELNASHINGKITAKNNNIIETLVYVGDWHKCAIWGRVKEHRYLVELNHSKYDSKYFEEIDGWFYLKKGYVVHHIDGNHSNNDLGNLQILTKGEHSRIHYPYKNFIRDKKTGRFLKNKT